MNDMPSRERWASAIWWMSGGLFCGPSAYQARTSWGPLSALVAAIGINFLSRSGRLAFDFPQPRWFYIALSDCMPMAVLAVLACRLWGDRARDVLALRRPAGGW